MPTIKGILSFPALFTPKIAKGATEPKYGCTILLAPGDPQIAVLQAEVEQAKLNTFPSGYTGADCCFAEYDVKYAGKDYYDPRFSGWYVFSTSSKENDRPAVVDLNRQPVIDPALVYSGMIAYISAGISGYVKGKGGIGGWLNGVMITDEAPSMGRLDGKPSIEQMFANTDTSAGPVTAPAAIPPVPGAAPALPGLTMTAAANGLTYAQYQTAGWSDQQLIDGGMATRPAAPAPAPVAPPAAPAAPVAPPAAPAAPAAPVAPPQLIMTAAANGLTHAQYVTAGWTDKQMIDGGVAIAPSFA